MSYILSVTNTRKLQRANQLQFKAPHIHDTRNLDVHDFFYMLEGEWCVSLQNKVIPLKKNDIVFLPANITHRGVTPCSPNTKIIYFHIYPEAGDGRDIDNSGASEYVTLDHLINAGSAPHIRTLFQGLTQLKGDSTLATSYVNTLLYELSRISSSVDKPTLASQIRDYILYTNGSQTNKEIASHFHLCQRTVENIFKETYGMPMHQYILHHKLKCTKQYLNDYPNITLYEIAQTLGFCNEHYLSHMFKKEFGVSPRDYKKSIDSRN
ncbi:MAG: AraC family transcriptional regulator [Clostridia bacterium]|nr:AraC family transcriptional regulator [Clostridia bacterium]